MPHADIDVQIGLDVIRSYRRLAYTPWHALAEFVDNSTQSRENNRRVLDADYRRAGGTLKVWIRYDRTAGVLSILDNAMGMSLEDLKAALYVGKPPAITSGRSQFGLGLKTAACWFGDLWSVTTQKLGESSGHRITVDVNEVASGRKRLPYESVPGKRGDHYTEIRIERLHQVLKGRRLGKTKDFLRSMYRIDTRSGDLDLRWDDESLKWNDEASLLPKKGGGQWREEMEFVVNGKTVRGWVGVLAPGFSGRSNAGFAMIRRGRLIRGWPEPWKPEAIFGPFEGSNDLVNQRITGEFHFDQFDVTHTKDDVLFGDDEEDMVEEEIRVRSANLVEFARKYRSRSTAEPRSRKVDIESILTDPQMEVRCEHMHSAVAVALKGLQKRQLAVSSLVSKASRETPALQFLVLPSFSLRVVVVDSLTADAPYAFAKAEKSEAVVVINAAHPACPREASIETITLHLEHALADAAAALALDKDNPEATSWKWMSLKDAVLRQMAMGGED